MINPAAMLGLGNDPAVKQLNQIQAGITTLFQMKQKDYAAEERQAKAQREFDKREAQDIERILNTESKQLEKVKAALKTSQGGLMAALLGGTALLGAVNLMGGFDLGKFIMDVKNSLVSLFSGGKVSTQPTLQTNEDGSPVTTGTGEDGEELGNLDDLEPVDPNFKGLSMPGGLEVTSKVKMRWGRPHNGVDIGGYGGEPLTVSAPSKVVYNAVAPGYGNTVVFRDQRGEHLYGHMQALSKFKVGDTVQPGQIIGRLGNTGASTGPHLHWEFDPKPGVVGYPRKLSQTTDPLKVFNWKTPFTGKQSGGKVGGKKDQWGINIGPGYTGTANLTKKTTGSKADKTATAPYGEKHLVKVMNSGGIKDKNERAMFMAQMAHESGNFKYHTELKPKSYYENNKNLANLQKGDGLRYLGRGYIQLTGRWNYDEQRKKTGLPLVAKPELAAETQNAGKIALSYWQEPRRESMRVAARKGDVKGATTMINKNHKGLADRQAKFTKYKAKGLQSGGVVGYDFGGHVKPTESVPENYQHYTPDFYQRQARRATQSSVIIVNNVVNKKSGSYTLPGQQQEPPNMGSNEISYTDIAQTYYRYVGGIKI